MNTICLAASSGGHLEEILNLRGLQEKWNVVLLTEHMGYAVNVWAQQTYYVPQVNRKEWKCTFKLIANTFVSLRMMLREKPETVISIGALSTIPVCLLAKLMGRRVIYIESFARIDSPSETGKLLYRIADETIVQWPDMLQHYPNAIYGGTIF